MLGAAARRVVRFGEFQDELLEALLARFGLRLSRVAPQQDIPGSYWGESEAGLMGDALYAREDTPVHSILHEAAHFICLSPLRRATLNRDAGGDDAEECAVCYLQLLLAEQLSGYGIAQGWSDMDAWGYSFRLGSTQAWFEHDAVDAQVWLTNNLPATTQAQLQGVVRR